jgi:hypothetical protein
MGLCMGPAKRIHRRPEHGHELLLFALYLATYRVECIQRPLAHRVTPFSRPDSAKKHDIDC